MKMAIKFFNCFEKFTKKREKERALLKHMQCPFILLATTSFIVLRCQILWQRLNLNELRNIEIRHACVRSCQSETLRFINLDWRDKREVHQSRMATILVQPNRWKPCQIQKLHSTFIKLAQRKLTLHHLHERKDRAWNPNRTKTNHLPFRPSMNRRFLETPFIMVNLRFK